MNNSCQVLAIFLIIDGCVWGVTDFFLKQTYQDYAPLLPLQNIYIYIPVPFRILVWKSAHFFKWFFSKPLQKKF